MQAAGEPKLQRDSNIDRKPLHHRSYRFWVGHRSAAREAPPGFRPLPMMQAMLEFAAPIMAYVENKAPFRILMMPCRSECSYGIPLPKVPVAQKSSRTEIVDHIRTTLQMDMPEAEAFFDHMIERKAYLFPDEIQPEGALMMFMRKEVDYLITQFEENQLQLSDEPIPPEREDHMFLDALRQLDASIAARPTMMTKKTFSPCRRSAVIGIITGSRPRGCLRLTATSFRSVSRPI